LRALAGEEADMALLTEKLKRAVFLSIAIGSLLCCGLVGLNDGSASATSTLAVTKTTPMVETTDLPCSGPVNPAKGFGTVTYSETTTQTGSSVTVDFTLKNGPVTTTLDIGIFDLFSNGSCASGLVSGPTTTSTGLITAGFSQMLPPGTVAYFLVLTNSSTFWTTAPVVSTVKTPMLETTDFVPCSGPVNPAMGFGTVTYKQTGSNVTANFKLKNGPANTTLDIGIFDVFSNGSCTRGVVSGPTTSSTGFTTGSFSQTLPSGTLAYFLVLSNSSTSWTTVVVT
jgi:hypothetical protein